MTREFNPDKAHSSDSTQNLLEKLAARPLSYGARIVDSDNPHFIKLRHLLAQDYLENGVVLPSQLDASGMIPDHYGDNSVIFDVVDKSKADALDDPFLAGGRLLIATKEKGFGGLQIKLEGLDVEAREYLQDLQHKRPGSIGEFATHLKADDASPFTLIALYRAAAEYSMKNGISHWVIGLRPKKVEGYKRLMGDALQEIGKEVHLGDFQKVFVPFLIEVEEIHSMLFVKEDMGRAAIASSEVAHLHAA